MNGLEKTIVPVCTDNDIVASRQRPGVCIGTARALSPPTFKPGEEESTYPEPPKMSTSSDNALYKLWLDQYPSQVSGVWCTHVSCPPLSHPAKQTSIDPSDESTAALDGQQRNA